MARTKRQKEPRRGPPAKYPWDRWLSRSRSLTLKRGKDYNCQTHSMVLLFRQRCWRAGIEVSIQTVDQDTIKVLFY